MIVLGASAIVLAGKIMYVIDLKLRESSLNPIIYRCSVKDDYAGFRRFLFNLIESRNFLRNAQFFDCNGQRLC